MVNNSSLPKAWYLVANQSPPGGIDAGMREWEKEAWSFFESTNHESAGRGPLASVKRTVLMQDHADTGVRCMDVENFVRAIYAIWAVRRLPDPSPMPWKNVVWHFINPSRYPVPNQDARVSV